MCGIEREGVSVERERQDFQRAVRFFLVQSCCPACSSGGSLLFFAHLTERDEVRNVENEGDAAVAEDRRAGQHLDVGVQLGEDLMTVWWSPMT